MNDYYSGFDDFDKRSQEILKASYPSVLSQESFTKSQNLSKNVNQSKTTSPSTINPETINWKTDKYINIELLLTRIKASNSGFWNYQFLFSPKELETNVENSDIRYNNSYIRLKIYRNNKEGNVGVEWDEAKINITIDAKKESILYQIYFYYKDNKEAAFILETFTYQEFRDLNLMLGYGDVDSYKDDSDYIAGSFAKALKKSSEPKELKYIYESIPESIMPSIWGFFGGSNDFFKHIEILSKDDDTSIFRDSSAAIIQIIKIIGDPVPILKHYRTYPDELNRIYYNLDGSSIYNGEILSNRKILANIFFVFCLFSLNEKQRKTTKSFTIGKGYKIGSNILEFGVIQGGYKKYDNSFFLQQQKEETYTENTKLRDEFGVQDQNPTKITHTKTISLGEGAQYEPLEIVWLKDLSGKYPETYLVPAIYLKALADAEEWQVVQENLRIAADLVAVVIGVLTLPTGNPYFLLLAIADISLAGADLTIQAFKDEIMKYEGGEEFLETWEKIYTYGGFALIGTNLITGFYQGIAKLLTKVTEDSIKNYLKSLVIKAVLETNITNFTKNTIKFVEPQELFLGSEYLTMGQEMAENGVIFLSGNKAGKYAESYAAVYKGEVIEEFTKAETSNFYKKWGKLKGAELRGALEELFRANIFLKYAEKFDANFINHLSGDIKVEGLDTIFGDFVYIGNQGQGGHYINKFLEVINIVKPSGKTILSLAEDIPFEANVNIKSLNGVIYPKSATSSMFPKNWSIKRIQEEVAYVFENTVNKGQGLKNTSNGVFSYDGLSTNGIEIRIQILNGKIINAHPINF